MRTSCMLYILPALANIHFCSCRLIVAGWSRITPRYKLVGSHTVYGYSSSHRKKFQNAIKIHPKLVQMASKMYQMASQMGHRDTILISKLAHCPGRRFGLEVGRLGASILGSLLEAFSVHDAIQGRPGRKTDDFWRAWLREFFRKDFR